MACSSYKPLCQHFWETSSLWEEFGYGELWHRVSSQVQKKREGSCPQLFFGSCVLMALGRSLLGQEFEQKWWSHLCSQVCQHSWETSSLPGYGELWHRVSSRHRWEPEESTDVAESEMIVQNQAGERSQCRHLA